MLVNLKNQFIILIFCILFILSCNKEDTTIPSIIINKPLSNGTLGIFFSKNQTIANAIIVAIIKGGIAILRSFPLS